MILDVARWIETEKLLDLKNSYDFGIFHFVNPLVIDNQEDYINRYKNILNNFKRISIHGPFSELIPASMDPEIIKVVNSRFNQTYEITDALNSKNLIFHSGFIPKTYLKKDWISNSIMFWKEFLNDKNSDIEIHIENVYENEFDHLIEIIDSVNNKNFSICLDIGHVNANSNIPIKTWIKELNSRIRYVHLHNNNGVLDDHFAISKGQIDIIETLNLLKEYSKDAIWCIETSEIKESLEFLKLNKYI